MMNTVLGLVVGLLVGIYLTASYPEMVIKDLQRVGVPLLHAGAHDEAHR